MLSRMKKNVLRIWGFCLVLTALTACPAAGAGADDAWVAVGVPMVFTINGRDLTASFTGVMVNNHPFGEGIYEFEDAHGPWSFAGTLKDGAFCDGEMTDYPYTIIFEDGEAGYSAYTGPFTDGRPSGQGVYTIVTGEDTAVLTGLYDPETGFTGRTEHLAMSFAYNGTAFSGFYTGEYLNGQPNGQGRFDSEGSLFFSYEGEWDHGNVNGPGELHTNNARMNLNGAVRAAEYRGHIENGMFNGPGSILINIGDEYSYQYVGEWKDNLYAGYGKLTVSRTDAADYTYRGGWKDGLYEGEGSLIYDSPDIMQNVGNFHKGAFRPTFVQLISSLCSAESSRHILSEQTIQGIEKRKIGFLTHKADKKEIDPQFSYAKYVSSPEAYADACFRTEIMVVQINRYDTDLFGYPVTEILGYDSAMGIYYGYYIGYDDSLQEDRTAVITAYPIGCSGYRNADGTLINSLRFIASEVSAGK